MGGAGSREGVVVRIWNRISVRVVGVEVYACAGEFAAIARLSSRRSDFHMSMMLGPVAVADPDSRSASSSGGSSRCSGVCGRGCVSAAAAAAEDSRLRPVPVPVPMHLHACVSLRYRLYLLQPHSCVWL